MTALAIISAVVALGVLTAFVLLVGVVLHAIVWLVLLPFRLAIALVTWPLALLKGLVGVVVGGVLLVVGLAAAALVAIGVVAALLVPLLPLAVLVFAVWALLRLTRRPAVA